MESFKSCQSDVRIPTAMDSIYKDECCFSFDSPESKDGLYVCLHSFLGFGKEFVKMYHSLTGLRLFLNILKIKTPIDTPARENTNSPMEKKPKRLAIGLEGGFTPDEEKYTYEDVHKLVILPEFVEISLEEAKSKFPFVEESAKTIINSASAAKKDTIAWDGEVRPISKHAHNLRQLDNGVKIPPHGLKCAKCDLTTNLWLNLTDGSVMCGRRYFDGTGGNNHGVTYFTETNYPLAVKLGTITPSGADVHSYDEDMMVEDPNLVQHLRHFGINMMVMEKTEQTMTEMEIDLNQKVGNEWDIIQEAGKKLKELSGPGLTGLQNMGNTCYMNSIMQVLYSIPDFQRMYSDRDRCLNSFKKHIENLNISTNRQTPDNKLSRDLHNRKEDMMADFTLHMCKVGFALQESFPGQKSHASQISSGDMIIPRPRQLKRIVGKGHSEFSTNRQQDAHEYLCYLFNVIERNERASGCSNPHACFQFMVEERIRCQQSGMVKYLNRSENCVSFNISMDDAVNKDELEEYNQLKELNQKDVSVKVDKVVRAKIPFKSCLDSWLCDEVISDFWSSATKTKGLASKRTRFATFPDYMVVHVRKFAVGADWVPRKLDVSVEMPDQIDLNEFRGTGLLETESKLPEGNPPVPEVQVNEESLRQLIEYGFEVEKCREALIATKNNLEGAADLLLSGAFTKEKTESSVNEESVKMITDMGFSRGQAVKALKETGGIVERALDWVFSHPEEPEETTSSAGDSNKNGNTSTPTHHCKDGSGKYEMFAFVSHMGSSTMCGHYVCHIKKNDRWVIYNDEKVAESVEPPKDLGYIYFYKRL